MPGEIFVKNFQFTITLQAGSANAWKKAIKQSYPNVIIGSQKTAANINMKVSKNSFLAFILMMMLREQKEGELDM